MPTGYGRQEHSAEVTGPLKTLIELYASQSQRLSYLSGQMANAVSALQHISGHIGEHLTAAHIQPGLVEGAAICVRQKRVTHSGDHVADDTGPEQSWNAESLTGIAYPRRAYGAPYAPLTLIAAPLAQPGPAIRHAQCGNVVLAVGSSYAAYSVDGGNTLTPLNPTATFPHRTGGGSRFDQVAQYLPSIDRFVWLMLFNASTNDGYCLRIAAASPREIICTRCTGWTYWDLSAAQAGLSKGISPPEISVRQNFLCVTIGQRGTELVVEIPLEAIRRSVPLDWRLSAQSDSANCRGDGLRLLTG